MTCSVHRYTSDGHANAADLLDEAIHLTSAFQLARFQHVVGTLWEGDDVISARIADDPYGPLVTADGLEYARSAAALRESVLSARDAYLRTPWTRSVFAGRQGVGSSRERVAR
ncbi:hypothetical protein [Streptomyces sp. NPDC003710]